MLAVKNLLRERVVVIADDLTGANEIASVMASRGKKSIVLNHFLKNDALTKFLHDYAGLVFNLNSRNLSGNDAYMRVKDFFMHSQELARSIIYKKIDSTVRGNIIAEIDAVLDAGCADMVALAPALPRMKRITVGGYHLVEGVPVNQSPYAESFSEPHLPTLIKNQSAYQSGYIDLQTIQQGSDAIYQKMQDEYERGSKIVVCDCCIEADLKNLKQALLTLDLKIIPVGSVGLFDEFFKNNISSRASLIVCGSLNYITRAQIRKLRAMFSCGYLELDPLCCMSQKQELELERLFRDGAKALATNENLIVATPELICKKENELEAHALKLKVSLCLARIVKKLMENFSFAGLVTTGGDTTMSILENLNAGALEIVDEIEPFVPVGIIRGGICPNVAIITKAGGFGTEDVFMKALQYINRKKEANMPNRRNHEGGYD